MQNRRRRRLHAAAILSTLLACAAPAGKTQIAPPLPTPVPPDDNLESRISPPPPPDASPTPTSEILVFLPPQISAEQFALLYGLRPVYALRSDPNAWVLTAASVAQAARVLPLLAANPVARAVYPNQRLHKISFDFTPNDPYYFLFGAGENHAGQWHLVNPVTPGLDAAAQGAWSRNITGQRIVVGVVDDCFETTHPDLAPNYLPAYSYDFGQNDPIPDPVHVNDRHGISVAGVIAARGGNGIGVTGVAPFAGLVGLRVDFPGQTTAMFVDATRYRSVGANHFIDIKNHSYGYNSPYIYDTAQSDAVSESASVGTIHCFAAGNSRGAIVQDSNKRDICNNPDVITVAALGSHGKYASYSSFGACVFVTAPSSTSGGPGITTTDRSGSGGYNGLPDNNYTNGFGGTSSATPLVAGVLALVKQAQPALDVRFAKHLLARNSDIVDADDATGTSDGGWKINAAGLAFNQNYGFGKINADRMTQTASLYTGVTPLISENTGNVAVATAIPDHDAAGLTRAFVLDSTQPLEEILVTLNVTHPYRGNLVATLMSPSGTSSRLLIQSASDSGDNIHWTFSTNAFWGENPQGTWTLRLADLAANNTGTWNSFAVTARMGTLIPRTFSGIVLLEESLNPAPEVSFEFRSLDGGATFTRAVTLPPSGAFEIPLIPAGVYDVAVKGKKWLRRVISNVDTARGSVSGVNAALTGGDTNDDNSVDVLDLDAVIQAFDSIPINEHWNEAADCNGDGSVDVLDLDLVIRNFDRRGDS